MAIPISELRIGNVVAVDGLIVSIEEMITHVEHRYLIRVLYTRENKDAVSFVRPINDLRPIPLSGEVLEACGFTKTEYDAHKKNPIIVERLPEIAAKDYFDFKMSITEDGWQIRLEETDDWDVWYGKEESWTDSLPLVSIKSLHQLMNLYFSLTGKELIYNPSK